MGEILLTTDILRFKELNLVWGSNIKMKVFFFFCVCVCIFSAREKLFFKFISQCAMLKFLIALNINPVFGELCSCSTQRVNSGRDQPQLKSEIHTKVALSEKEHMCLATHPVHPCWLISVSARHRKASYMLASFFKLIYVLTRLTSPKLCISNYINTLHIHSWESTEILTGTTSRVDMKLLIYSTRKGSEDLFLPSSSMVLGTSAIRDTAALKNASAGIKSEAEYHCLL